jgi:hypothetical protein
MTHTLSVEEDGTIETLWTDALPLAELGTMTMKRASRIEFNEEIQMWEVFIEGSRSAVYANQSRRACLDWEIEYFNRRILEK